MRDFDKPLSSPAQPNQILWLWFLAPALLLMISGEGFWHDEIVSALYAQTDSWETWIHRLIHDHTSEAQMPLFLVWARFLELCRPEAISPEWWYRVGNLPGLLICVWCFQRLGHLLNLRWLPLLWLIHPFVWMYTNEFRPYMLQLTGGCLLLTGLLTLYLKGSTSRSTCIYLSTGSVLLAGSSMLGFFAILSVGISDMIFSRAFKQTIKRWVLPAILVAPIGLYDLWTFLQGSGGAKLWSVGPTNLLFAVYEFLGLSGLGPPRNVMRDVFFLQGISTSSLASLGIGRWILAGLLPILLVCGLLGWKVQKDLKSLIALCTSILLLNWIFLFAAALAVGFPFWGRHLSPSFPAAIVLLGIYLASMPPRLRIVQGAVIGFLIVSSLTLRFHPQYKRDDLRSAMHTAQQQASPGDTLWWGASPSGGLYYQNQHSEIAFAVFSKPEELVLIKPGDVVVLGRTSLHDPTRKISAVLMEKSFAPYHHFPGATVWKHQP